MKDYFHGTRQVLRVNLQIRWVDFSHFSIHLKMAKYYITAKTCFKKLFKKKFTPRHGKEICINVFFFHDNLRNLSHGKISNRYKKFTILGQVLFDTIIWNFFWAVRKNQFNLTLENEFSGTLLHFEYSDLTDF